MAPARMMQFIDQHVRDCTECQEDIGLHAEVEKIRGFVLPESKIPKAIREQTGNSDIAEKPRQAGVKDDESKDDESDEDNEND